MEWLKDCIVHGNTDEVVHVACIKSTKKKKIRVISVIIALDIFVGSALAGRRVGFTIDP